MTAALPQFVIDLGAAAGVFVAVAAATAVLWKTPPVRWFRRQVSESLGEWLEGRVQSANAEHYEYVRYHLGPNGTTKPIHQRLSDVERAVSSPPQPFVDWNGPYDDVARHEEER